MAHISDGILALPVLVAGATVTAAGCALALRKMDMDDLPKVGLLSAAFFVASFFHLPAGPTSLHLMLVGLTGIFLGAMAFPALLVALLLQAVMFGYGGIAVLGVNVASMALAATLCGLLFPRLSDLLGQPVAAALCGALGVALTMLAVAGSLATAGDAFFPAIKVMLVSHLPLMAMEAAITALAVSFVCKVRPDALAWSGSRA